MDKMLVDIDYAIGVEHRFNAAWKEARKTRDRATMVKCIFDWFMVYSWYEIPSDLVKQTAEMSGLLDDLKKEVEKL